MLHNHNITPAFEERDAGDALGSGTCHPAAAQARRSGLSMSCSGGRNGRAVSEDGRYAELGRTSPAG